MDVMPLFLGAAMMLAVVVAAALGAYWTRRVYEGRPGPDGAPRSPDPGGPAPLSTKLTVINDPDKLCSSCAYFDLEEGQAAMQHHRVFFEASKFVPMNEMGRPKRDAEDPDAPADDVPNTAKWTESGLCARRSELIWGKTDAARRARMKGGDAGEDTEPGSFLDKGVDCYAPAGQL